MRDFRAFLRRSVIPGSFVGADADGVLVDDDDDDAAEVMGGGVIGPDSLTWLVIALMAFFLLDRDDSGIGVCHACTTTECCPVEIDRATAAMAMVTNDVENFIMGG